MCDNCTVQRYAEFVSLPKTHESLELCFTNLQMSREAPERLLLSPVAGESESACSSKSVQFNAQFGLVSDAWNVGRAMGNRVNILRNHKI